MDAKSSFQVLFGTSLVAVSSFEKYLKTFLQLVKERCVLESVFMYLGVVSSAGSHFQLEFISDFLKNALGFS